MIKVYGNQNSLTVLRVLTITVLDQNQNSFVEETNDKIKLDFN